VPGAAGDVVPTILTGAPLGPAQPRDAATDLLVRRGLAVLAGRWWCRLPSPLPAGLLDAAVPEPDWPWQPVLLVEVSPTSCWVRPEMPAPEELTARAQLPVPVGELLRAEPPA
jgi:hypothetical protein